MDPTTQRLIQGAAGAASGPATYVDDVFSTFLYEGNGSSQTITNGIDISGEGGLVWCKNRNDAVSHILQDTERGTNALESNSTSAQFAYTTGISSFTSSGFTVGVANTVNGSGKDICSWTFRKAPGFFDVVTYTGDGTANRAIAHGLGSVPGVIIIKCTSNSGTSWAVYHRSIGTEKALQLNTTNAVISSSLYFPTAPTSSEFFISDDTANFNASGRTYVAYIFAHDDQSFGTGSDEAIIKCGSFTTDGSGAATVDLGFEPQWILTKPSSATGNWGVNDIMRGMPGGKSTAASPYAQGVFANLNNAEGNWDAVSPFATGFNVLGSGVLGTSTTGIYIAIRRPNKPPEAATDVFNAVADAGSSSARTITAGNLVDLQISKSRNDTYIWYWLDRLRGAVYLTSSGSSAESSSQVGSTTFDVMDGMSVAAADGFTNASPFGGPYIRYFLTRAPGFFDVVTYTGTGSSSSNTGQQNITHNLGAVPELIIVKTRDGANDWVVYNATSGAGSNMRLNRTHASASDIYCWDNTTPTSSVFRVGSDLSSPTNTNTKKFIAYLFATLDGISKVGTYSGTGSDVDVDCGFSAGARFILIKRTDSTGDWYTYDSTRGITSGNDPYSLLNANDVEATGTDYIDPLNSGFTVTSTAPAALNASGGTYLFLAIA